MISHANTTCEVTGSSGRDIGAFQHMRGETIDDYGDRDGDKKLINIIFYSEIANEFHGKLVSSTTNVSTAKKGGERQISS